MNLHEYQSKRLLADFGMPVPLGRPVLSAGEIDAAVDALPGPVWVVKSQIHAGGRGAGRFKENPNGAGGVRVCRSKDEAKKNAREMLGATLVTRQTGPAGKKVQRLYIEHGTAIAHEYYLSALIDRKSGAAVIIASKQGGMDIEEVAHKDPKAIMSVRIDPVTGISSFVARRVAFGLGFTGDANKTAQKVVTALYHALITLDASLIEINPLVLTSNGEVMVLDSKVSIDDNAMFRHPELAKLRDETEENPNEIEASNAGLNYVQMEGSIGCLVNGAGLAMATMDAVAHHGGTPANFLDVGGGATSAQVSKGFQIIMKSSSVKAILVNIFGGIMRGDIIANGILQALKEVKLTVPLVVRIEGTNSKEGREILQKSGMPIIIATDLSDAAKKAIAASKAKA